MKDEVTPLPLPFVTNVIIDARADDVHISVDPALIFTRPIAPGEKIPLDQETGVSLNIQKGKAISIIALMENDKADQLVEALVTCIVRGDPDRQKRAEALLAGIQRAMTAGFERPALVPMTFKGVVIRGGDNAQVESDEGRAEDDLPCCTQDDLS